MTHTKSFRVCWHCGKTGYKADMREIELEVGKVLVHPKCAKKEVLK